MPLLLYWPNALLGYLIITSFIVTATGRNLTGPESPHLAARDTCGADISGNSDLYGLGIRVGVYLQWISSLLTNVLIPAEVSDSLDTNSIFLFAVFIAIANASTTSPALRPAEAFIMLQLCFGYLLSVVSVSGLRVTLLSDPHGLHPDLWLTKLRKSPNLRAMISKNSALNVKSFQGLFKGSLGVPPPGVVIPRIQFRVLRALDLAAAYSVLSGIGDGSILNTTFWSLQPTFWAIDFLVIFLLPIKDDPPDVQDNPVKAYRQERLRAYQAKRKLTMDTMRPQLFSLGLKSVYKNDQVSWLGICWRSCLVAGIAIYNVWFWFTGAASLATDACPTYIFLFSKANINSGVGTFYKVMSIVYMAYGGLLFLACLFILLAFFGTTIRALIINLVVMPYARLILFSASVGNKKARKKLDNFENAQNQFLDWLDIPNLRQLLTGFAYLSSNPKESLSDASAQDKGDSTSDGEKNAWLTGLRIFLILTTIGVVIWTVIAIELTLIYNSITDVYEIETTGQLIPFIIGIVSTGKTMHLISLELIKKQYPNWSKVTIGVNSNNRIVIKDVPDNLPDIFDNAPTQDVQLLDEISKDASPHGTKET